MILQIWKTLVVAALPLLQPPEMPNDASQRRALRRTPTVQAYERVRDSVVNLAATQRYVVNRGGRNLRGDVFGAPMGHAARSVGSGFVIHEDGYIVTNAHVVSAGADLKVTFEKGTPYEARIIGRDTARDLAVIKIEPGQPLMPIPLGRSDDLMIGEPTIAVGNPVGLHSTVTTGVISALHRELIVQGRAICRDVIQTDAIINPGNSGGPLLNIFGELIGINTAIRADAQNIGFAIPVDQLRALLPEILDGEKRNNILVGLRVGATQPPLVLQVRDDSPASAAGVRPGDIIEAIDGHPIRRGIDYHVAMLDRTPDETIQFDLRRAGQPTCARLTVLRSQSPANARTLALGKLGIVVADVRDGAAQRLRWGKPHGTAGVIVLAIEPDGPAREVDLQPGDLLVSMGTHWLTNVDHVGTLLANVAASDPIDVGYRRERSGRLFDGEARLYAR